MAKRQLLISVELFEAIISKCEEDDICDAGCRFNVECHELKKLLYLGKYDELLKPNVTKYNKG